MLAMLMLASFASCGKSESTEGGSQASVTEAAKEATIVGNWKYVLDFSSIVESTMKEAIESADDDQQAMYGELFKCFNNISMDMYMNFGEDGKVKLDLDEDSAKAAIEKIKNNVTDSLPNIFKTLGIDDLDAYLKSSGKTKDELTETLTSSFDVDSFADKNISGVYRLDGNKLYITNEGEKEDADSYMVIELTPDTLKFIEAKGSIDTMESFDNVLFPMIFVRVK